MDLTSKKGCRLITILGLMFLGFVICLFVYPAVNFDFYEQCSTITIVDLILIALYSLIIVYDVIKNINKGGNNWLKYLKDLGNVTLLLGLFYVLFRKFFVKLILIISFNTGQSETVNVDGKVVDKISISSSRVSRHVLTVQDNENTYVFQSNKNAIDPYYIGKAFKMKMRKGRFGFLYKCK